MYNTQKIAERIKQRTKPCGFSMKTMLSDLELGINIISHLAKGQVISSVNLARIADYLGCSVDYLLGRTDYPEINNGQFEYAGVKQEGTVIKTDSGYIFKLEDK